ncbi:MAG: hypothetical protein Q3X47_03805 [Dorea sp.]|uniref:hypothetical protein n=1 Tax=Dorea sp. TaxID=2040332 RepID=UPI00284C7102|nr:hypothetical protein [Dorea sp.]MDR3925445.1 hypothetical protein [Dorea sp.]
MAGLKALNINTPPEAEPHIYAEDDAAIYKAIFGGDGVSTIGQACKATVLSNNKVRIADGVLCVDGHMARIPYGEYEDCEIMNGQSGKNRNDIIVAKFETTGTGGIDTMTCEVIQGTAGETAVDPELTQDDIYAGGKVREYPLYRVKIEGLSITAVEKMFEVIPTSWILLNKINELSTRRITHTLLYYNADGTTGTFTLSDSVKNYDYIEIFYNSDVAGHKAPQKSIKLPTSQTVSSGDMLFDMTSFRMSSGDGTKMQLMNTILNVSGKTCKPETSRQINFGSTAGSVAWTVSNTPHHRVYRVVGYNYGS